MRPEHTFARPDLGRVWCLDHVEATFAADSSLHLHNPTAFPARVRILIETAEACTRPLDIRWSRTAPAVELAPGADSLLPA